ncbi:methylmalonyl Co-A mutase-associated GTPase MeaB [Allobacillus sp. GCM10007491]|uniref:Methylmalonyl Co-A mutase-associated GTPase MeaB n=1 Tax=Allobacillus saliphilus TaxID=2912308 RepID=A0A941CVD1_9BACI|nr:methylmalonyl Co-A mutase-associated GTPase MeaB [Allobacillus saliphilus]MBR7554547.1 methylmalonyl Co-A mutase-associated GTPase MeaB [Allobacillus saliphilus]
MEELVKRIQHGNQRALARAITMIENDHPEKLKLMDLINRSDKKSHYIGITGSPGAGKSSLVDRFLTLLREKGFTVAVIAVDPTSPFSGGALLGDRVRMTQHFSDEKIFIRSMATRGSLGGLARATKDAIRACDAYGFDYILIETVGVGQSELDIMKVADTTSVVLTPNSGDVLQVFKAGIMEIADLFILNKADIPGVKKLKRQLKDLIHLSSENRAFEPEIVETSVVENFGFDKWFEAIENHQRFLEDTDLGKKRRANKLRHEVYELIQEAIWKDVESFIETDESKQLTLQNEDNSYALAEAWYKEWKEKKRG